MTGIYRTRPLQQDLVIFLSVEDARQGKVSRPGCRKMLDREKRAIYRLPLRHFASTVDPGVSIREKDAV